MTKSIATKADTPTHKLTVKTEDGRYKVFYVTEKQAERLRNGINGPDKFICLSKDVDKDAPSFYPKYGSCLERISKDEKLSRSKRYELYLQELEDEKKAIQKKFETEAVDAWIEANKDAWESQKEEAFKRLSVSRWFHSVSDSTRSVLVRMEARRNVHDTIIMSGFYSDKRI